MIAAGKLLRHVAQGRLGQLRMQQTAVAGHAAAGRAGRHDHVVGDRLGDLAELLGQAELGDRAGRVQRHAGEPAVDVEVREQAPVNPLDRVEQLDGLEALAQLVGQLGRDLPLDARGCRSWRRSPAADRPPSVQRSIDAAVRRAIARCPSV